MTYRGTVKNGAVVLEEGPVLQEGTSVNMEPVDEPPTWADVLKDVIGKAKGLPSDLARNHDHYIHGAPKKRRSASRTPSTFCPAEPARRVS